MLLKVIYDNGNDYCELEYYSKYKRINTKGIQEEIRHQLLLNYGSRARNYTIVSYDRI